MEERFLGSSEITPDILEAYQEFRVEFWRLLSKYQAHIKEWYAEGEVFCEGLTLSSGIDSGLIIDVVHIPEYSKYDFEGYIGLTVGDYGHEYGIYSNGAFVLYRHLDYKAHGLSSSTYLNLDEEEREELHKNMSFEHQVIPSPLANLEDIREINTLLKRAFPVRLD